MQEEVGLAVVTDGEFRRGSYWARFVERVDGFAIRPAVFNFRDDHGHEVAFTRLRGTQAETDATARARRVRVPARRSPGDAEDHAAGAVHDAFLSLHRFCEQRSLPGCRDFFADLTAIYRAEIQDLVEAGCRYVQLDEVAVALLCDPAIRQKVEADGQNPDRLVDRYIASTNDAVAGLPDDATFGVHMCRGNFKGHYLAAGG